MRIAQGDLASARALFGAKEGRIENVAYLTQQAIEKALKAVLCFIGEPVVHTHDIDVLVVLLPNDRKPPESHLLGELNSFATVHRYEEGFEELDRTDFGEAIGLAERTLVWAQTIII